MVFDSVAILFNSMTPVLVKHNICCLLLVLSVADENDWLEGASLQGYFLLAYSPLWSQCNLQWK